MLALISLAVLLAVIAASLAVREVRHRRRKARDSVVVPIEDPPEIELETLPEAKLELGGVHVLDNPTPSAAGVRKGGIASLASPFYNIAVPVFYYFRTSASVVTPWYLSGGIALASCVAAYKSKGAASLAASYVNQARPGTNDAAPGNAPTFSAATGWTFDGVLNYLVTGIVPGATTSWSVFVQFSDVADGAGGNQSPWGTYDSGGGAFLIQIESGAGNKVASYNGQHYPAGYTANSPKMLSGNYGVAGKSPYRNGVVESTLIAAGTDGALGEIYIGAVLSPGPAIIQFLSGKIQALAIYSITLSSTQAAALSTAMTAL